MENHNLFQFDEFMRQKYGDWLCGSDEVGRGSLVGRIYGASVVLPVDFNNKEIKDSKKLTSDKIKELYNIIIENALAFSIIYMDENDIDKLGINPANKYVLETSARDVLKEIKLKYNASIDIFLYDNFCSFCFHNSLPIIKGDNMSLSIASASILAKYSRDLYIEELFQNEEDVKKYKWDTNKGYGSKEHIEAINKYGLTKYHRKSFKIGRI